MRYLKTRATDLQVQYWQHSMLGMKNSQCWVMKSVQQVQEIVASGNVEEARSLAVALKDWFPGHADYMDASLSQWMCKKKLGGTPIVLRRNILDNEKA